MFQSSDDDFAQFDTSSIKYVHSGSQIVSRDLIEVAFKRFKLEYFLISYGMSETLLSARYQVYDPKMQTNEQFPVGKPWPFFEFKVVDLKDGKTLLPLNNTPGELLVKSFTLFNGYWNEPEKTKDAFTQDGW